MGVALGGSDNPRTLLDPRGDTSFSVRVVTDQHECPGGWLMVAPDPAHASTDIQGLS
jgi:hypothetical protein